VSYLAVPNKLGAKFNPPLTTWRLLNTDGVIVGLQPRMVLACRARRDVELLWLKAQYEVSSGATFEAVLVQVPHVAGLRRLKPEGEPHVWGQENVNATPMFGGRVEDAALGASHVRWNGETVQIVERNVCVPPYDYWGLRCRISIPKWATVGVIVRADKPSVCRVEMKGI
jgi:hypothetical protein